MAENVGTEQQKKVHGYRRDCIWAALCLPVLSIGLYFGTVKQIEAGGCPIVLDVSGNGSIDITGHNSARDKLYTLFSIGRYVEFDIFGNGELLKIDWIEAETDAFLVDLREGFPQKNATGKHLFGASQKPDGSFYNNGFEKLASLDVDKNGLIEGSELEGLALWRDNGDAVMKKEEILPLSKFRITAIPTKYESRQVQYGFRSMIAYAETADPENVIYMEDVWFMTADQPEPVDRFFGNVLHPLG